MISDTSLFFNWWASWFLLGIISWPATHFLFGKYHLSFRSYAFAKVAGLLAIAYPIWLGASLHWFAFSTTSIFIAIGLWMIFNGWIAKKKYRSVPMGNIKITILNALRLEFIFFVSLAFWSWIRTFQPNILDLEKFMDYGFVNSILRTNYFPPADMWFSGGFINYYYFGHYLTAFMIRLSNVPSSPGYNLMIATLFALSVMEAFTLGVIMVSKLLNQEEIYNVKTRTLLGLTGILCAFLLTWRGNLHWGAHTLNQWINGCSETGTTCTQSISWLPDATKGYWYPDATRYIPFTIHEFPIYSFVVADLHAHLINLPVVLFMIVLLISMLEQFAWWRLLPIGMLLGIFYMSNAWDLPIYWLLLGITLLVYKKDVLLPAKDMLAIVSSLEIWALLCIYWYLQLGQHQSLLQVLAENRMFWVLGLIGLGLGVYLVITVKNSKVDRLAFWELLRYVIGPMLLTITLALLTSLPFTRNFVQIAQGVLPVHAHSEISKLLVLWGWDLLLMSTLVTLSWRLATQQKLLVWDYWILGLYALGFVLIIIPEVIYVKDIYIEDYHRANTMFKLVYQSWVLFAVAGSYTVARVVLLRPTRLSFKFGRFLWMLLVSLLLIAMGQYPLDAIASYYNLPSFRSGILAVLMPITTERKALDGELWLRDQSESEYHLLRYLKELPEQPTILEATGDSYTQFNRFSAYAGLPTVEGWLVHEWLWRGGYDQPGMRAEDVEHIYTSADFITGKTRGNGQTIPTASALLRQYTVRYVVIGDKEREKYQERLNDAKFSEWPVAFAEGNSKVYVVPAHFLQ